MIQSVYGFFPSATGYTAGSFGFFLDATGNEPAVRVALPVDTSSKRVALSVGNSRTASFNMEPTPERIEFVGGN